MTPWILLRKNTASAWDDGYGDGYGGGTANGHGCGWGSNDGDRFVHGQGSDQYGGNGDSRGDGGIWYLGFRQAEDGQGDFPHLLEFKKLQTGIF